MRTPAVGPLGGQSESGGDVCFIRHDKALENGAGLGCLTVVVGMAGSTGLEPATSGLTGRRSNQLNYDPTPGFLEGHHQATTAWPRGGRYWIRTSDPLLVRQVLSR